jgi:glutamate dehydrogenase/leucine dehydrogenase
MEHEQTVLSVRDEGAGLEGWVVIDTIVAGMSSGGLRMTPTVDEEELRLLARTMTLKYGFLGFPKGGAKAGIRFDPERDPAGALDRLGRFGREIRPLIESRRYYPGPDMGTDDEKIRHLIRESGAPLREEETWPWADSGRFTAVGLVSALLASARHHAVPERDLSVTIEGIGAVGLAAARLLAARGVRVSAVSNRFGRIACDGGFDPEGWETFAAAEGAAAISRLPGGRSITREEFLSLPVVAFLPCAASRTLREEDAGRLGARWVVSGANHPFDAGVREALETRGAIVLPDFVTNAGGVLGGALAFGGLSIARSEEHVRAMIGGATAALLSESARRGVSPVVLAERTAKARFLQVSETGSSRLLLFGLSLRKKGMVPRPAAGFAAEAYARSLRERLLRFE